MGTKEQTTTRYTVSGAWPFPADMLRYDHARPATDADAELLKVACAEIRQPGRSPFFTINLVTERSKFFLEEQSSARWRSFGWKSSLDSEHMHQRVAPQPPSTVPGLFASLKVERLGDGTDVFNIHLRDTYIGADRKVHSDCMKLNCNDERSARLLFAVLGNSTHACLADDTI